MRIRLLPLIFVLAALAAPSAASAHTHFEVDLTYEDPGDGLPMATSGTVIFEVLNARDVYVWGDVDSDASPCNGRPEVLELYSESRDEPFFTHRIENDRAHDDLFEAWLDLAQPLVSGRVHTVRIKGAYCDTARVLRENRVVVGEILRTSEALPEIAGECAKATSKRVRGERRLSRAKLRLKQAKQSLKVVDRSAAKKRFERKVKRLKKRKRKAFRKLARSKAAEARACSHHPVAR